MEGEFYTWVGSDWTHILLSGYEGGKKFNRRIEYQPSLYRPDPAGKFKTIKGKPLAEMKFSSLGAANKYVQDKRRDAAGALQFDYHMYGLTHFRYSYLYENYKQIEFNPDLFRIGNFDIETDSADGYGDVQLANREIISITVKLFGKNEFYVVGRKPYETKEPELLKWIENGGKIRYLQCASEEELLRKFIRIWQALEFDVVTNWNGEFFDIPYIIKRIILTLGEEEAKKLSPFRRLEKQTVVMWGKQFDKYEIAGIPNLDYLQTYKKFSFGNEETYKLEYIASKILGVGKLDYSEYGSLNNLYQQNHNKFIDYNIIDVLRVEQLDDFLQFIGQIVMIAHFAKVNFADTFGTVRTWDIMIHNHLMDQGICIPQSSGATKDRQIAGGYVKLPIPGKYPYVMSFDLTSLYPHLFMMYNISPETYLGKFDPLQSNMVDGSVVKILAGEAKQYTEELIKHNVTVSGKGTVFTRDKQGFLPKLMKDLFVQRKAFKNKMLKEEASLQDIKAEIARRGLK